MLAALALASSLLWGTSDFLAGLKSRSTPAAAVVGWSQAVGLLVATAVLVSRPAGLSWQGWPLWSVLAGLAGALGLFCFYAALSGGTMGVVAPVAALGAAVPVALGVLTGEQPSPLAWVGMAVALAGVALASGPELRTGLQARTIALAAAAAVCFGLVLFFLDRGARVSLVQTLWGMRLTSTLLYAVAGLLARSTGGVGRADLPVLALVGVGDLAANALFALASSRGLVSLASVLGSLYPVVTILLARAVLGERLRRIQQLGVVLAMLGVAALAGGGSVA